MPNPELPYNPEEMSGEQTEALVLLERIQETEKAFNEAHDVLSNLDLADNRIRLSQVLSRFEGVPIVESDLEGSRILELGKKELQDKYGVMFFPLTLAVPVEKWAINYAEGPDGEPVQLSYADAMALGRSPLNLTHNGVTKTIEQTDLKQGAGLMRIVGFSGEGGYFSQPRPDMPEAYPFSITGISLLSEQNIRDNGTDAHEELHRIYALYSPFAQKMKDLAGQEVEIDSPEFRKYSNYTIINEINAYRTGVSSGEISWDQVAEFIMKSYPFFMESVFGKEENDSYLFSRDAILQACKDVEFLSKDLGFSESVITHILLNCESLDDLARWRRFDSTLISEEYKSEVK